MIKKSLRMKLALVFLGIMLVVIVSCFLFNSFLLPKYYRSEKEKTLIGMYEDMNHAISGDIWDTAEYQLQLERDCQASNVSVFAVDMNGQIYLSNTTEQGFLKDQLLNNILNHEDRDVKERIRQEEAFCLEVVMDTRTSTEYMDMWGLLSNGCCFILRTPLEGIIQSVKITNELIFYTSLGGILFGVVLIIVFTKGIIKPVKELTDISKKMADLDFDTKYAGGGEDEIGILGDNFNRMSSSLEKAMSDLKAVNLALQKDIEQKNQQEQMRCEFIANVSHELKTPLALIEGYAEGLKDNISDDPESREFYCEVILDETEKMNRLVKDLLRLNEIEFGKQKLVIERFRIGELLTGVCDASRMMADKAGVSISCDVPEDVCVWGDEYSIEQVVTNYVSNGIHYAKVPEQAVQTEMPLIRVFTEKKEGKLRVNVYNSGDHIPQESMSRIWEKFYKVDKARTREYGGNGIGLSIVKAIMDSHGQGYGVNNVTDGVVFWFELNLE